jgi:hypothetical protein
MMSTLRRSLPLVLAVTLLGCGDGSVKLPTAPVVGKVTYQGKPLGMGRMIFFHPSGQAAAADLTPAGTFSLIAYQGKNQVGIECFGPERPGAPSGRRPLLVPPKSLIPARYVEPATSGLTLDVKAGNNEAEFVLKD